MADLTLYTNPMSRGRIARWMLEEVGQPYEAVVLGYKGEMKSPEYLAINPMGKVPALVHNKVVVTEGAAICAYLADAFPAAGLKPKGHAALAAYYRWLFFAAGPVEAAVTDKSRGIGTKGREMMVGYGSFAAVLDALEGALKGKAYIAGDTFSAADVYVGAQIGWGLMFKSIPPRQAFLTYWGRLQARPAHVRASELDDAAIPKEG